MDASGSMDQIKWRVRNWKCEEIEGWRHKDHKEMSPEAAIDDTHKNAAANPEDWSLEDLKIFCEQNGLYEVGTKSALIIRVKNFMKQPSRGGVPSHRHPQRDRMDINGYEVYTFKTILGQSTVTALKSALFIAGNFPPEAILTLHFKNDFSHPLQDDVPLINYNQARSHWTDLRLKVVKKWKFGPGGTKATAIVHDTKPKIKFSTPPLPGCSMATAIEVPDFPVVTFGDAPAPSEIMSTVRSDSSIKREFDLVVKGANPTFSELLTSMGNRAPRLNQMVTAGDRFQRPSAAKMTTSGLAILEEVEDFEEDEESWRRDLEALMKERQEGGRHRDIYPPPGTSHMADLFYATFKEM